ncbi:hypothetical protein CcrColossus_gp386 [Caulobacter phage CcrColossus]|uniref:Uncharacterized protein n=1 Tax=Caulobacter phage CcrColossus TaxID=1211640 RepID=K4JSY6_9CAUD|nr:hypothetical protein CcrColossus_gp386 [Caulobacter phage CcrColossus]AFU88256.1 hypothetical protein CcrColossus_gp386 [Caulobacter phage CcrColossus]
MTKRRFKIKTGVRPYPGKVLLASYVDDHFVHGHVIISRRETATGERVYSRSEVEEITE